MGSQLRRVEQEGSEEQRTQLEVPTGSLGAEKYMILAIHHRRELREATL